MTIIRLENGSYEARMGALFVVSTSRTAAIHGLSEIIWVLA